MHIKLALTTVRPAQRNGGDSFNTVNTHKIKHYLFAQVCV